MDNGTITIIVTRLPPQKIHIYIQGERNHMLIVLLMRCCLLQYKTNTALEDEMFPNGKIKQFF